MICSPDSPKSQAFSSEPIYHRRANRCQTVTASVHSLAFISLHLSCLPPHTMPPQLPLDVILGVTPVPGLSAAFNILKLIISSVEQAHRSKRQLHALAASVAQLLETLNTEFRLGAARIVLSVKPLKDLYSLLDDIQNFIREEQERPFYKVLLTSDSRMAEIDDFYRRIGTMASAFQESCSTTNCARLIQQPIRSRLC
ncbi:hypothetical protein C8R43DRAFT_524115 [Mycena crocata]|nr:hypothetical protein C8R43DRAFT_524115 [Mycena crocata]